MGADNEEEPRSRARWFGLGLIVLALVVVGWLAWASGFGDEPPPHAMPAGSVRQPSLREMLDRFDTARVMPPAQAALAASPVPQVRLAPDEAEVCGLGVQKVDASGQLKDMTPVLQAGESTRTRLLPALLGSSEERARAAGLLLMALGPQALGDAPVSLLQVRARDALAGMAQSTQSPEIYAWAMRACQHDRSEGACQLLNADQWARVEPGNAMAWLQVAVDAQARLDGAAVAEAMYRASQASAVDSHWNDLVKLVLARLPADATPLAKGALADELAALEAGVALPHLIASQFCTDADVRDANRRQTCSSVAEVFKARGTTLTDVGLAATLGERVGWSAERVDALRDERDAVLQVYKQRAEAARERWSCAALDKSTRQFAEISQQGEVAVMRRSLKEQADPPAALAQRYREASAKPSASGASAAAVAVPPGGG